MSASDFRPGNRPRYQSVTTPGRAVPDTWPEKLQRFAEAIVFELRYNPFETLAAITFFAVLAFPFFVVFEVAHEEARERALFEAFVIEHDCAVTDDYRPVNTNHTTVTPIVNANGTTSTAISITPATRWEYRWSCADGEEVWR